jgi:hypothetical protein
MNLARRAVAVLVLVISLAATGLTTVAQQPVKAPRIGILTVARIGDVQEEKNFGSSGFRVGNRVV